MDTLGSRIAYYRKQMGISQEKLAELLGISRQAVAKWENDKSAPATENLIRLTEILGIPLIEFTGSDKARAEEKRAADRMPEQGDRLSSVCCMVSAAVLVFYLIYGAVIGPLDIGTAVIMTVIAVMMQAFVHLYFSNAAKSGDFNGIAGYDSKTAYVIPEVKRLLIRMDRHIGITSTGCMLLLLAGQLAGTVVSEIGERESSIFLAVVSVAYFLEFVCSIAWLNYQSIDMIFVHEIDKQKSRAGWWSSCMFLLVIAAVCAECAALFAGKHIKNNTAAAMQCGGYVILVCILACVGLFLEQGRLKRMKTFEEPYRLGKGFWISNAATLAFMILMAVTA